MTFIYSIGNEIDKSINNYSDPNYYQSKTFNNISSYEYEGMVWLRDNTDRDALIVSDRYFSVNPETYDYTNRWVNTHFLYAAYSQRRHYLEGSGFSLGESELKLRKKMIETNNCMYNSNPIVRNKIAGELNVDYVVVSKRFNDPGNLESSNYKLCFSNKHIIIYKII